MKYVYSAIVLLALTTLTGAVSASAQTTPSTPPTDTPGAWVGHVGAGKGIGHGLMKLGVFGTVISVSGNIVTVSGKQGFGATATTTTFTVDATNAKIMKNNVAGTISSIAVGDTIMAQGTLTGTNLVATMIRDGQMGMGRGMDGHGSGTVGSNGQTKPTASPFTGNGQPVVAGTVSSVSGSTLMIANKSNVSYTVDATNAKILQGQNTISISSVAVGDSVVVQGVVNGSSITASTVLEQAKPTITATGSSTPGAHQGFFGSIGSFFSHLFGF